MTAGPSAIRVVFMGSPPFAVPSLEALVTAGYDVVAAVTQPDRPAGRGAHVTRPAIKTAATNMGIPVLQPESLKDPATQAALAALQPDLFVVAAYGRILPRAVLAIPTRGCVNVHASLLPRWRGASPIAAAILAGDEQTGVSIMEMVFAMDAGPVIEQAAIPIPADATTASLEPTLAALGAATLVHALPPWLRGELPAQPQDESAVTTCTLIKREHAHLAATLTALEAERSVRAYDPWPGAFVLYRGQPLTIWRAHVLEPAGDGGVPGDLTVVPAADGSRAPAITFRGGLLVLDEVQRPGSRRMPAAAFLNGERGALPATVELR